MIKVIRNGNNYSISGHANFDEYGKDIVCAAVSSIITTAVNCIMNIDNESITYSDDGKVIDICNLKSNSTTDIILDVMYEELKELSIKYKKNITIDSEE